ncbi:MAG TPA: excinuclease ABC subunit UvrA [Terriglobia bacterium]|nr:excinuclease ABC subunit UvrA [Terriglobia bacterium]
MEDERPPNTASLLAAAEHGLGPPTDAIVIKGARVHNLKNIDCEIPHNRLTVVTGVSGSGKSSLAFDTVYAEGQRRYVESLSAYARQFLDRMEKPDVDSVDGIAPAVAIRQKNTTRNPRSTVGTATEIYDYLRLLFARAGVTTCSKCGGVVKRDTVDEIADRVLALEPGRRFYVLFPLKPGSAQTKSAETRGPSPTAPASSAKTDESEGAGARGSTKKKLRASSTPAQHADLAALKSRLSELREQGFNRLYQQGRVFEFSTPESLLDVDFSKPVFVLVDRLAVGAGIRQRLIDSAEICYRQSGEAVLEFVPAETGAARENEPQTPADASSAGGGSTGLQASAVSRPVFDNPLTPGPSPPRGRGVSKFEDSVARSELPSPPWGRGAGGEGVVKSYAAQDASAEPERLIFNERFECKRCGIAFTEPEPRLFSFNNPFGACPRCQGFGNTIGFDMDRVVPDKKKTLAEGAVEPLSKPRYRAFFADMKSAARDRGIPLDVPYFRLSASERRWVMEGDEKFPGVNGFFEFLERKKYKLHVRIFLSRYRGYATCPDCHGGRLRREALNVRVAGKNIGELCALSIEEADRFFSTLQLAAHHAAVADKVLEEVRSRLRYLVEVGLEYLTLDRLASTLSGGEAQRIQLATALGSSLVGTLYVLDEPSIGLHARDTGRLIGILKSLRDLGNTILVVEHDPAMMQEADHVIDLGPGAGERGGRVVVVGGLEEITANRDSLTGRYLAGELQIQVPARRRRPGSRWLRLRGAREHNLKSIDVEIPLGLMVAVSGVSGSGKSTMVHDVLYQALAAGRGLPATRADYDRLEGDAGVGEVVLVDQSPLGRSPRSNPVTYIKAYDSIREIFAATPEARAHGYTPGHFSFNLPGGRCETCQGAGTVTVEMQFLADVELVCEECRGRRFKPAILDIRYKGRNIDDVLGMTVREALAFFSGHAKVTAKLRVLDEVGLGYLRLGQSATTLSGGEAQRVRLAAHIAERAGLREDPSATPHALFIFDEPTTGLHFDDIHKLLAAFQKLINAGASVLVIEHNLDVLKTADWIIDLGPEGGDRGGFLVAAGPPEEIVKHPDSYTGRYLAPYLAGREAVTASPEVEQAG